MKKKNMHMATKTGPMLMMATPTRMNTMNQSSFQLQLSTTAH